MVISYDGYIPDLFVQLHSIQFKVRSDGTCVSQAKYLFSGTAIIYVNPARIHMILTILKTSPHERNDHEIDQLPTLFNLEEIFIYQMNLNNEKSCDSDSLFLNNEQLFTYYHSKQSFEQELTTIQSKDIILSSLNEEIEYLYSLFTDLMNPLRSSPRVPDKTETLPLRFPYTYIGDAIFHVNDESKIFRLDLQGSLVTK